MKRSFIILISFLLLIANTPSFAKDEADPQKLIKEMLTKVGLSTISDDSILGSWVTTSIYKNGRKKTTTTVHSCIVKKEDDLFLYESTNIQKSKKFFVTERKLQWVNLEQQYASEITHNLHYRFKEDGLNITKDQSNITYTVNTLKDSLLKSYIQKMKAERLDYASKIGVRLGEAKMGMKKNDVLFVGWGKPDAINRTRNMSGSHEQWVYKFGCLYFDNDILSTIQD